MAAAASAAAAAARRAASSGLTALTHRLAKQFSAAQRNAAANGATAASTAAGTGNLVLSPLSIYSALSLVAAGAGGRTLGELLGFLGARSRAALAGDVRGLVERATARDAARPCAPRVVFASGLWHDGARAQAGLPRRRRRVQHGRGASRRPQQPDEARGQINSWVAAMTSNLIDSIVDQRSVTGDTRKVITNAIYFKGKWEKPFTMDRKFHRLDGHKRGRQVPMTGSRCSRCRTECATIGMMMMMMMTRRLSSQRPCNQSTPCASRTRWPPARASSTSTSRTSAFHSTNSMCRSSRCRSRQSVKRCLMDLGVGDMFWPGANLQDMLENDGSGELLFVGDVLHMTVIDVHEQGTEAAAATAVFMLGAGTPPKPPPVRVDFVADHPFAFFLVDEVSGAVLFAGHVLDPTQSE
ncbi:hypothetical protein ACP70R_048524 [Stipagrostis hirtigluma subsp. patula]